MEDQHLVIRHGRPLRLVDRGALEAPLHDGLVAHEGLALRVAKLWGLAASGALEQERSRSRCASQPR